jgi:FkbM family methyltransferase
MVDYTKALCFMNRNWVKTASNVLHRRFYPSSRWSVVDNNRVEALKLPYGIFNYTPALQGFPDVFEQCDEYRYEILQPDDVVLDLGANVGVYTIRAAQKVKHVYALEPLFIDELRDNVALNGLTNVTCLHGALSDQKQVKINFCGVEKICMGVTFKELLEMITDDITVIKTDCEGGEYFITPEELKNVRAIDAEVHNFIGMNTMNFVNMLTTARFISEYHVLGGGHLQLYANKFKEM